MKRTILHYLLQVLSWRPGKLAKGTIVMTAGMGLRSVGQIGVFLILTRVLGIEVYGEYVAVLAIATSLGCLSGFGVYVALLRDTARNVVAFATSWGQTLAAIAVTAPVLFGFYFLLAGWILPPETPRNGVVFIGLAELVFFPIILATIHGYQGYERMGRAARVSLLPVVPRLLAALVFFALADRIAASNLLAVWAFLYLIAATAAAIYAFLLVKRDLGANFKWVWKGLLNALRDGWGFAVTKVSVKLYADIDKAMLARLSTLEATGAYSAAYRVTDMISIPLQSLMASAAPRFFRAGKQGVHQTSRYALYILPLPLVYAAIMGMVVYYFADLLPQLLGSSFSPAVEALQWLAWLPLVSLPRILAQFILFSSDKQRILAMVLAGGALVNIVLNLLAIPRWGWQGAAGATYATEAIMTFAMVMIIWKFRLNHPAKG